MWPYPALYKKVLAKATTRRPRSRDFTIDCWDPIPVGREAAEEMMSMTSSGTNSDHPGKPGPTGGNPGGQTRGSAVGESTTPSICSTTLASAPTTAANHQAGPAAAAQYVGSGYEGMNQARQTSTFYPLLRHQQP